MIMKEIEIVDGKDELFSEYAYLYHLDPDTSWWKERGVGDVKILKCRKSGRYRILMHCQQIMACIADHAITEEMRLVPMQYSNRAWTWRAEDESQGRVERLDLAVRFKTRDLATKMKIVFDRCRGNIEMTSPQEDTSDKPAETKSDGSLNGCGTHTVEKNINVLDAASQSNNLPSIEVIKLNNCPQNDNAGLADGCDQHIGSLYEKHSVMEVVQANSHDFHASVSRICRFPCRGSEPNIVSSIELHAKDGDHSFQEDVNLNRPIMTSCGTLHLNQAPPFNSLVNPEGHSSHGKFTDVNMSTSEDLLTSTKSSLTNTELMSEHFGPQLETMEACSGFAITESSKKPEEKCLEKLEFASSLAVTELTSGPLHPCLETFEVASSLGITELNTEPVEPCSEPLKGATPFDITELIKEPVEPCPGPLKVASSLGISDLTWEPVGPCPKPLEVASSSAVKELATEPVGPCLEPLEVASSLAVKELVIEPVGPCPEPLEVASSSAIKELATEPVGPCLEPLEVASSLAVKELTTEPVGPCLEPLEVASSLAVTELTREPAGPCPESFEVPSSPDTTEWTSEAVEPCPELLEMASSPDTTESTSGSVDSCQDPHEGASLLAVMDSTKEPVEPCPEVLVVASNMAFTECTGATVETCLQPSEPPMAAPGTEVGTEPHLQPVAHTLPLTQAELTSGCIETYSDNVGLAAHLIAAESTVDPLNLALSMTCTDSRSEHIKSCLETMEPISTSMCSNSSSLSQSAGHAVFVQSSQTSFGVPSVGFQSAAVLTNSSPVDILAPLETSALSLPMQSTCYTSLFETLCTTHAPLNTSCGMHHTSLPSLLTQSGIPATASQPASPVVAISSEVSVETPSLDSSMPYQIATHQLSSAAVSHALIKEGVCKQSLNDGLSIHGERKHEISSDEWEDDGRDCVTSSAHSPVCNNEEDHLGAQPPCSSQVMVPPQTSCSPSVTQNDASSTLTPEEGQVMVPPQTSCSPSVTQNDASSTLTPEEGQVMVPPQTSCSPSVTQKGVQSDLLLHADVPPQHTDPRLHMDHSRSRSSSTSGADVPPQHTDPRLHMDHSRSQSSSTSGDDVPPQHTDPRLHMDHSRSRSSSTSGDENSDEQPSAAHSDPWMLTSVDDGCLDSWRHDVHDEYRSSDDDNDDDDGEEDGDGGEKDADADDDDQNSGISSGSDGEVKWSDFDGDVTSDVCGSNGTPSDVTHDSSDSQDSSGRWIYEIIGSFSTSRSPSQGTIPGDKVRDHSNLSPRETREDYQALCHLNMSPERVAEAQSASITPHGMETQPSPVGGEMKTAGGSGHEWNTSADGITATSQDTSSNHEANQMPTAAAGQSCDQQALAGPSLTEDEDSQSDVMDVVRKCNFMSGLRESNKELPQDASMSNIRNDDTRQTAMTASSAHATALDKEALFVPDNKMSISSSLPSPRRDGVIVGSRIRIPCVRHGIIRWIGWCHGKHVAGVELEPVEGTYGEFHGKKLFDCSAGMGMVISMDEYPPAEPRNQVTGHNALGGEWYCVGSASSPDDVSLPSPGQPPHMAAHSHTDRPATSAQSLTQLQPNLQTTCDGAGAGSYLNQPTAPDETVSLLTKTDLSLDTFKVGQDIGMCKAVSSLVEQRQTKYEDVLTPTSSGQAHVTREPVDGERYTCRLHGQMQSDGDCIAQNETLSDYGFIERVCDKDGEHQESRERVVASSPGLSARVQDQQADDNICNTGMSVMPKYQHHTISENASMNCDTAQNGLLASRFEGGKTGVSVVRVVSLESALPNGRMLTSDTQHHLDDDQSLIHKRFTSSRIHSAASCNEIILPANSARTEHRPNSPKGSFFKKDSKKELSAKEGKKSKSAGSFLHNAKDVEQWIESLKEEHVLQVKTVPPAIEDNVECQQDKVQVTHDLSKMTCSVKNTALNCELERRGHHRLKISDVAHDYTRHSDMESSHASFTADLGKTCNGEPEENVVYGGTRPKSSALAPGGEGWRPVATLSTPRLRKVDCSHRVVQIPRRQPGHCKLQTAKRHRNVHKKVKLVHNAAPTKEPVLMHKMGCNRKVTSFIQAEESAPPAQVMQQVQSRKIECPICFELHSKDKMSDLAFCGHQFCSPCLMTYFRLAVLEKEVTEFGCPQCGEPDFISTAEEAIKRRDLFLQILEAKVHQWFDADIAELYQKKLMQWSLQHCEEFCWCAHCEFGFLYAGGDIMIVCPQCNKATCADCRKPWAPQHRGISCQQFAQWQRDNDPDFQVAGVMQILEETGISCPKCQFRYQLVRGGCMHFTCVKCKHEFCCGCNQQIKRTTDAGLSTRHPRNCLYYLRDHSVTTLISLLEDNGVVFQVWSAGSGDGTCQVMEQKQFSLKEEPCGLLVETNCDGLCKDHYIGYLVSLINKNSIDPVSIMSIDQLKQECSRHGLQMEAVLGDSTYKNQLCQFIMRHIPLSR